MSTETKLMKLMPHTRNVGPNGNLLIEPGDRDQFEVPPEFRPLYETIEAGASLSKVVDQIDGSKSGPRFRLIKKFLIFLDEHDMLADRDYIRLAESLNTEYSWPTSILSTELFEVQLSEPKRQPASRLMTSLIFLLTVLLGLGSLALALFAPARVLDEPSPLRALGLFLITYSVARSFQGTWALFSSSFGGSTPRFDLVIEPISISLRAEQRGRPLRGLPLFTKGFSFLLIFGVAAFVARFAHSKFEFDVALIAGAFAFLTETNPYARSSMTDLIKALYSAFQERGAGSGDREDAIKRVHVTACIAWIFFLGLFYAIDVSSIATQILHLAHDSVGTARLGSYVLLGLIALFTLNYLADLIGSVSYDEASDSQIRRMWKRKQKTSIQSVQGLAPSAQDLEQLPFLRQIPAEIRKALLGASQVRAFTEGQAICKQGDKDRNLFVVIEGRLAVARTSSGGVGQSRRKVVAWLNPGAVFGENAFFFGQPRTADVVGMESGRVLVLPHLKALNIEDSEKSNELRVRIWFLQALVQNPFFKELPSESLDSILHAGTEQRFPAGTRVIQEGEQADACYFMVQGRATVTQKTKPVGKINAGDAFGEISILFPGTLRTATVVADTDLMTIKIERERFWKLLKTHLPLALEIERMGLRRMKQDSARA